MEFRLVPVAVSHEADGRTDTSLVIVLHIFSPNAAKNVKLCLCLIQHHDTKAYEEVETYFHAFLTAAFVGGE